MNFNILPLRECVETCIDYRGKTPKKLGGEWSDSGYRAFSAKNIKTGNIVRKDTIRYLDEDLYKKWMKDEIDKGDILVTSEAPFGEVFYWNSNEKIVLSQRLFGLKVKKNIYSRYIYYYMQTRRFQSEMDGRATGSTVRGLRQPELLKCEVKLPALQEQKSIANILSSLDDKIEINNKINKNLEEMAQALYKQWFVDFEFPNEDGEPYKSSGGKMIESELGLIPIGWEVSKLENVISIYDNKRIPLSKNEREKRSGDYPYYGAAALMDYVDDYIFDGRYVLLGEDGTVEDKAGYPVLQFVEGKFWVNNHAHVLDGKNGFDVNSLYVLLKNTNIHSIVTGAVQKKINQTNLKNLKIILPNIQLISKYNHFVEPIFDRKLCNERENKELSNLIDILLPKLMSGEIRVPIKDYKNE